MTQRVVAIVVLLAIAAAGTACRSDDRGLPAGVTWTGPARIVDGLDLFRGHAASAFGLPDVARPEDVTVARVDLRHAGLRFSTTPAGGPSDPARPGHQVNTTGTTVSGALDDRPDIRLAINANFFWPCCQRGSSLGKSVGMTLFGLSIDNGTIVSDPGTQQQKAGCASRQAAVPSSSDTGAAALVVERENQVRLVTVTASDAIPTDAQAAVAGGPQPTIAPESGCGADDDYPPLPHVDGPNFLLSGGRINATPSASPPEVIAARTFAGVSADGRYLFLATIDGGESSGAAFYDEASWLQLAGASEGLNLDGGGSSTMALDADGVTNPPSGGCGGSGRVRLLNVPYGFVENGHEVRCGERLVGNYLAVHFDE